VNHSSQHRALPVDGATRHPAPVRSSSAPAPRWLSYTEMVVATFLWGALYPAGKPVLAGIPPQQVALMRAAIAFVVLGAIVLARGRQQELVDELRYRPWNAIIFGVLSFVVNSLLSMFALQMLPASVAGLIVNTSPLFLAIGAVAVVRPNDSTRLAAGAALAFAGVALVVLRYEGLAAMTAVGSSGLLGVALALANSVSIALSTVYGRRILLGRDPIVVTCLSCAWGALPLALLVALQGGLAPIAAASSVSLLLLAFLGVGCTAVNFALFNHALQSVPAERASAFQYISPPVSAVLAFAFLGEPLTWSIALGGVLIIAGVALAQERREQQRSVAAPIAEPGGQS